MQEYARTGLLGCGTCYTFFREELMPELRRLQGKTSHEGKTPVLGVEEKYSVMVEKQYLQDSIERARQAGRTEEEKRLTRKLRALEEGDI